MDDFERLKASVKGLLRDAESELDDEKRGVYADLLLATYQRQSRRQRLSVTGTIVGSAIGAVILYTIFLKCGGFPLF